MTEARETSFYRRPLPAALLPFASAEGRTLFREALAAGTMEGYFALAEQFHTQSEPAFCGLGTLVIALNALAIDPGRTWRGPWRWFGEEMLDCCRPLDQIKTEGITLPQLVCLARCNGALATLRRADESSVDDLRGAIVRAATTAGEPHLIVSYARSALGQTGEGHFSPIGGFHAASDRALLLDVARFKYPPHWVPVTLLWDAMQPLDPATSRPRGFVELSRATDAPLTTVCGLSPEQGRWKEAARTLMALRSALRVAAPEMRGSEAVARLFQLVSPQVLATMTAPCKVPDTDGQRLLLEAVRSTELYALVRDVGHAGATAEVATLLLLALIPPHSAPPSESPRSALDELALAALREPVLARETRGLRVQLEAMVAYCDEPEPA